VKALARDAESDHDTIAHFIPSQAGAFGSGPESEHLPAMLDSLEATMRELNGKEKLLANAIVEGDTGCFSETNLREAEARGVNALIPDPQFRKRDGHVEGRPEHGGKGRLTAKDFEYDEAKNRCPAKKELTYKGQVRLISHVFPL
jgi:hypothetical protein